MNETKWTPGPWLAVRNWKITAAGRTIADTRYSLNADTCNAEMMAAAPELYEALEGAVRALENLAGNGPGNLFTTNPKLALAKARGEK